MFTYQIRPRKFQFEQSLIPRFPTEGIIRFSFLPEQPFGGKIDGGLTTVLHIGFHLLFNQFTGQHWTELEKPLAPLDVMIEESGFTIRLDGRVLSISKLFESLQEMNEIVESFYFGFPVLLNIALADPPFIEEVNGEVGGNPFMWLLSGWRKELRSTTQEKQEQLVKMSFQRMKIVAQEHRRRLLGGLHYYHQARRLSREAKTAGEFMAEVILNLSKTLEILFPSRNGMRSRDSIRKYLEDLEFTNEEIEGNFLPAIALRNEIDVGHIQLGLFTLDQLKIIHAFTDRAEMAFRDLFERIFAALEKEILEIPNYNFTKPRRKAIDVIERLRRHTPSGAI
jgi:hypothetical protein